MYEVFCALLYVLKSGCQWRMIPSDFPEYHTVYYYFSIWKEQQKDGSSALEQVLKKISWRHSYEQWSERENKYDHFGRPKREE